MWQFSQAVEGLADGCLQLGIPVTGGNVSFYNQTGDVPIHPTPSWPSWAPSTTSAAACRRAGRMRATTCTCSAPPRSSWTAPPGRASCTATSAGGRRPSTSTREKELGSLLSAAAYEGLLNAAHDLADGGLAIALAEGVLRFGVGARVFLDELLERDGVDAATALFSESTGRVLVAVPREEDVKFTRLCEGRGYPVLRVGVTDSEPAPRGAGCLHRIRRRACDHLP